MTIMALSWIATIAAWALKEHLGASSPALRIVFGMNVAFHPALFMIVWLGLLPLHAVEKARLLFAAGICAACMALFTAISGPYWSVISTGLMATSRSRC